MKKHLFLTALLCSSAALCRAAETLATAAATLELDSPKCELSPQLFTPTWEGIHAKGGLARSEDGTYPFTLEIMQGGGAVSGHAVFSQTEAGAIKAVYTFMPERDVRLNALFVGLSLTTAAFGGGSWKSDTHEGRLPSENKGLGVMSGKVSTLTLATSDGQHRLVFAFPEPTAVMIQDDRQWGPTFSLRIGHNGGTRLFKNGEPFVVRFTLETQEPQRLTRDAPVTLQAGTEWVPLKPEADILPGSALDFTALRLADAPAGKYGRVIAKGPHFEFENKPGMPQRFYGVNLCFTANYLEPAQAAALAAHLARIGYNALRLHHYDNGLVEGSKDGTTLNPDKLACLDALVAACVTNGIYLTTDLFVSRRVPYRAIGIDRDGELQMDEYKTMVALHEGAFENLKSFTRQLLTHVNPHTGRRYADEPALAWLALVNEGNLGNFGEEMQRSPEWQKAWATWLAARQAKDPAFADIPDALPKNLYGQSRHVTAYLLFLEETEMRFAGRMKAFLRDELKCRALVTNMSSWVNHASDQVPRAELYDYVDDHFYVDHPQFIERPWQLPSKCANVNPIRNEAMGAQNVVFTRLLDKPFILTEYNYSGPGRFRGIGGIVTGAMGALQDWSGIWRFAYSHSAQTASDPEHAAMGYFDMAGDPLSQASERAALCLFLRGDLAPLTRTYTILIPKNDVLKMRDAMPQNHTSWPWLGWYARLGTQVADTPAQGTTWSGRFPEVYQLPSVEIRKRIASQPAGTLPTAGDGTVSLDQETGTIILKTPRTCGGFTEKGLVDAGALTFDVGDTAATVWVSALDDQPIASSSRLLLTHLTDVQNSGIRYAQQSRKTLLAWGGLPHLVRNGKAEIRLAVKPAKKYKVYVLSTSGRRLAEIPSHVVKDRLAFTAAVDSSPETAVLLYEIAKE